MARLITLNATCDKYGYGKSKTYADSGDGTFPSPVKRGRSSRWVDYEVDEVVKARIAGKSDDEIRLIVARQLKDRVGGSS
ncbi:MAG: transcriptional regulator [Candidatus Sedimenticola sp. (ex Thyasira tokunagai)]